MNIGDVAKATGILAKMIEGDNRPDCPILMSLGNAAPDSPVPSQRDRKKTRGFERV